MKQPTIAIVGSVEPGRAYEPPLRNISRALEAARQLGRKLAEAGYRIVVYSSESRFIESEVVKGYLESGKAIEKSIEVRYPRGRDKDLQFPMIAEYRDCFDIRPDPNSVWEVSFYDSIHSVDGILLLGGGKSTLISGLMAIPSRKPLLAVAEFGGSAEAIWRLLRPENHIATAGQIQLMGQPWSPEQATELVRCLTEQVKKHADLMRENLPEETKDGARIAWLSDLHLAKGTDEKPYTMNPVKRWFGGFKYAKGNRLTQHFPKANLQTMLDRIQALKPDHILVTGDLTNWAKEQQFSEVRELFKNSQMMIRGKTSLKDLDPALWTILPGNHDVTETNRAPGKERRNLGMFFQYFGELYPGSGPDYGGAFPVWRQLPRKAPDGISVHLFGIDSNVEYPVSTVGLNARGRIDDAQLDRFAAKLEMPEKDELVLVALHHHPVIVPHIVHELEDYFLSLKEEDGKKLIKLCANTGVHAVLHGHFHQFSFWSVLAPQGTHQMAVIGAPCGTMDVPGVNVDFLELREASREARSGPRRGLALYRHSYQSRQWKREYIAFVE